MSEIKGCMNCGNISCKNNKKRESKGCGRYISPEDKIKELEKEVTRLRNENLDIINKYTRFAETDRRTIAELEAQVEKMKCCGNCKYGCIACGNYLCELLMDNCNSIPFHCDKWEIKEND